MKKLWIVVGCVLFSANLTSCTTWFSSASAPTQPGEPMAQAKPYHLRQGQQPSNVMSDVAAQQQSQTPVPMQGRGDINAASFGGMSGSDRNRLAHALDSAPGKATHWTNVNSGVTYTVTPLRKVVVNNNHLCRTYQTAAERNGQRQEFSGTACITDDGNWHNVNGG